MPDYNRSKIYKIYAPENPEKFYIGSTTKKYLSIRFNKHRTEYKYYKEGTGKKKAKSFDLFDLYGLENCKIILLENFPCANLIELWTKEKEYIINNINCVINKIIPILSESERIERKKEYYLRVKQKRIEAKNTI
jgi:preprotein translocase subunit SecA